MNPPQLQSLCKWPSRDAHFADNRAACHRQSHGLCNSQIGSSMSSAIMQKNAMSASLLHMHKQLHMYVNSATRNCYRRYNSKIFAAVFLFTCTHAKPPQVKCPESDLNIHAITDLLYFREKSLWRWWQCFCQSTSGQLQSCWASSTTKSDAFCLWMQPTVNIATVKEWKSETKWSFFFGELFSLRFHLIGLSSEVFLLVTTF